MLGYGEPWSIWHLAWFPSHTHTHAHTHIVNESGPYELSSSLKDTRNKTIQQTYHCMSHNPTQLFGGAEEGEKTNVMCKNRD